MSYPSATDGTGICQPGHESKLYIFFTASGVHPIINPPRLSAEARDATGPSLSGGQTSSPGRRVSGLGGPELVTPMLLLQLRPSSSSYSEMMDGFHAALTSTCSNEICIILWQLSAAHAVMVDETKPNSSKFNLLKSMNFQRHQKTVSGFKTWVFTFLPQGSRK